MHERGVAVPLCCVAALFVACSQGPPQWEAILNSGAKTRTKTATSRPTTDELVVYLDTSKSIEGYVAARADSVYGITLRELRNVGSLLDPPLRTWVRKVDSRVGELQSDVELNRASSNRAMYSGKETNLALAIAQFGQPTIIEASTSGGKKPPIPLIHVLVTDGVQSTDQAAMAPNCDSGSDQVCVRQQLSRWLRDGWSASIIGIRSEFRGTIYSEINHNSPGQPYAISYASDANDPASMRPFYLYIFSPDREALAKFVAVFKRRLKGVARTAVIRELPLNDVFTSQPASARVLTSSNSPGLISIEGGHQTDTDRVTIRFEAKDARDNAATPVVLRVQVPWSANVLDMGTPQELARLVSWEVVRIDGGTVKSDAGRRIPQIRIGKSKVDKDGSIEVNITPVWPAGTGERSWVAYALRGRVTLDEDTPAWIRDWSTDLDTAPEYGNRTLFLENAALGIWRSRTYQPDPIAEIYIRVGP